MAGGEPPAILSYIAIVIDRLAETSEKPSDRFGWPALNGVDRDVFGVSYPKVCERSLSRQCTEQAIYA